MAARITGVFDDWPRWKIALAIGAPVALGAIGVWYVAKGRKSAQAGGGAAAAQIPEAKEPKTPLEKAVAEKNRGNVQFKAGKYDEAIELYTSAIEMCPPQNRDELATFYQNRAAAHEQLKNFNEVVSDCGKALDMNTKYTKALTRRARACEKTNDLTQSLEDITAVCILESFQNQTTLQTAERVLKQLGKDRAEEAYKNRVPTEPSKQYIRTYSSTFCNDPIMEAVKNLSATQQNEDTAEKIENTATNSDVEHSPYRKALEAIRDEEYASVLDLASQELKNNNSPHRAEALLLRATFHLLWGDNISALKDFDEVLALPGVNKRIRSNALIKRGSLRLQVDGQTDALDDLSTAMNEDPENSDVYHHRGQLNLLVDKVDEAVKDFQKSVSLSPNFPIAQVQKCYTEYRQSFMMRSPMQLQSAMKDFEKTLQKFPNCSEGFALYGQALCDQQQFEEADKSFEKALELEPDNANIYVHRGLLALQWKQDSETSADFIKKALEVDDKCEFAYETLGTIEVQRGNLKIAIQLFEKAISLARTEVEMAHLYSLRDAAQAQANVAKNFGIEIPQG